jgi:hypothetical protein
MPTTNVMGHTTNPQTLAQIATNRRFGKSGNPGAAVMAATFRARATRPPQIPISPKL